MHKIIQKKQLSEQVYMMRIDAPLIAEARQPGQFIILQVDTNYGERIPLTISDANAREGWIRIIFQAVGSTTIKLGIEARTARFLTEHAIPDRHLALRLDRMARELDEKTQGLVFIDYK